MSRSTAALSLQRLRVSPRLALLVAAGFMLHSTAGCLSNEYRIPQEELNRLVQLAPEQRGGRVHVIQQLGERKGQPVPPGRAPTPFVGPPELVEVEEPQLYVDGYVDGHIDVPLPRGGASGARAPIAPGGHWRSPSAAPVAPTPRPTSTAAPARGGWRGGSGGGGLPVPSGGGKGEELVILAVIVAAVAAFAVVGLAVSEGARFDGYTELHPQQTVHLENAAGDQLSVPLAALSRQDVLGATLATVMDDESPGLRLLDRRPLDRVGPTFKVTVGSLLEPPPASAPGADWENGVASAIQVGGFFTQGVGLLASLSLGGGTDSAGRTFQRHGVGVEAQAFPLRAGPLSLGAFAHGGLQLVGDSEHDFTSGPAAGGGLLLELALSTRLAFSLRGGWTAARLDGRSDWIGHGTITAGLAIY